jgi:hypothetical protein
MMAVEAREGGAVRRRWLPYRRCVPALLGVVTFVAALLIPATRAGAGLVDWRATTPQANNALLID